MKTRTQSKRPAQAAGTTRQVRLAVDELTWRRLEALAKLEGIRCPALLGQLVTAFVEENWKEGGPDGRAA